MSSAPLFGFEGRSSSSRKSGCGGWAIFFVEHRFDLGRPEELVLDVDESLRCLESADVGLEDGEVAPRRCVVDTLGHGADDLELEVAGRRRRDDLRERLTRHFVPAHAEVLGDVGDGGAFDAARMRRASRRRSGRMVIGVVSVARLRGEVDAADERDAIVDDDRLLVVAVHRPFFGIEGALDLRVCDQPVSHRRYISPRGSEEGQRRAGPGEHAHVDSLGQLGEEVPKDERLVVRARARTRG